MVVWLPDNVNCFIHMSFAPLSHRQFNMREIGLLAECKGWQYVGPGAVRTSFLMYVVDWLQSTRLHYIRHIYLLRLAADRRTSLSSCVEQLGENTTCKERKRGRRRGRAMRICWSTSCRSHCQATDHLDHWLRACTLHHWKHARARKHSGL